MNIELKPLDIVVVKGKLTSPLTWAIMLKSISPYSHCLLVKNIHGDVFDPNIGGILNSNIRNYYNRKCKIIRFKSSFDKDKLCHWVLGKQANCEGYDYLAWLGFATGIKYFESENRWFCSELPYWMFQDNGYKLTSEDVKFIYPSDLARNPLFDTIYEGKIKNLF